MLTRFTIDVSYRQFYVEDINADPNYEDVWAQPSLPSYQVEGNTPVVLLGTIQGGVLVSPARDGNIDVEIELLDHRPTPDLDAWDHVVECSIDIPSGRIRILGCLDYPPTAPSLDLPPGTYSVLVYYGGFDTIDRYGLTGDDHYRVTLWPGTFVEPRVIK